MRRWMLVAAVSLALLATAGTAAAQPCEPWCLDATETADTAASGGLAQAATVVPAILAGAVLVLRRASPGARR